MEHSIEAPGLSTAAAAASKVAAPAGGTFRHESSMAAAGQHSCTGPNPLPGQPFSVLSLKRLQPAHKQQASGSSGHAGATPDAPTMPVAWRPGLQSSTGEKIMPCGLTLSELEALVSAELLGPELLPERQQPFARRLPPAAQPAGQQPLQQHAQQRALLEHAAVMAALRAPLGSGAGRERSWARLAASSRAACLEKRPP